MGDVINFREPIPFFPPEEMFELVVLSEQPPMDLGPGGLPLDAPVVAICCIYKDREICAFKTKAEVETFCTELMSKAELAFD